MCIRPAFRSAPVSNRRIRVTAAFTFNSAMWNSKSRKINNRMTNQSADTHESVMVTRMTDCR
eukprot:15393223-Alexandrium_andersonii.AAC.1